MRRALRQAGRRLVSLHALAPHTAPPPPLPWLAHAACTPPPPGAWRAAAASSLHTSAACGAWVKAVRPHSGSSADARGGADGAAATTRVVNADITARSVRLVRPDGTHAVLRRADALAEARVAGLDLVQVDPSAEPPVCRLLDWARERQAERQREKEERRRAVERRRGAVTKEVRLGLRTAEHDLRTKAAQAARALEDGHRAKVVVLFAGRAGGRDSAADPAARAAAETLLEQLRAAVQAEAGGEGAPPLARLEAAPSMDGATMWCRLAPAAAHAGAATQREKRHRDAGAAAQAPPAPPVATQREKGGKRAALAAAAAAQAAAQAALPAEVTVLHVAHVAPPSS